MSETPNQKMHDLKSDAANAGKLICSAPDDIGKFLEPISSAAYAYTLNVLYLSSDLG